MNPSIQTVGSFDSHFFGLLRLGNSVRCSLRFILQAAPFDWAWNQYEHAFQFRPFPASFDWPGSHREVHYSFQTLCCLLRLKECKALKLRFERL